MLIGQHFPRYTDVSLKMPGTAFSTSSQVAAPLTPDPTMRKKLLNVPLGVWIGFFSVSIIFVAFPQIDLGVAELFYTPGVGFRANGVWYEKLMYKSVEVILISGTVFLLFLWLYSRFARRPRVQFSGKELGFLLLVLALGPGLIVNSILKENCGRARPVNLIQFGGSQEFSRAFLPSDQGGHSFPSGHAAGAFFLMTVALILTRRKRLWIGLALGYGFLVGLARMAAGGHFLSDILTSFFIVLILSLMLHGFMFSETPQRDRVANDSS
ncbi:MAG: phosphatase PAP2 family protein [Pseudomonadota bacterium]|nr:phosphatase PAP2 family protein [Pseudomonadota bacterium]